jgi:aerobic carbon-monoxide dehydrogenase large subunit
VVAVSERAKIGARFLGQSVVRKEDRRLLTGHGHYVDDVRRPRTLHVAFVRSDVAKARLVSVDTSSARTAAGVAAVFTAEEVNAAAATTWHPMMGEFITLPSPLAVDDVRYVGDPIACVVANSRALAEDACEQVVVEYDVDVPVVDYRRAADDVDHVVVPGAPSNVMHASPFTLITPGLDDAFARAAHVVDVVIEQNRYNAVPMEGRGILVSWNRGTDEVDIVMSSQSVHGHREFFARLLQVPAAHVHLTQRDVGGGFGSKMFVGREEAVTALAAKLLGRTVKWVEDRRENLLASTHARNETSRVRMAVAADGTILGATSEHTSDLGAYPQLPGSGAGGGPSLAGPYRIRELGGSSAAVWTNTMGRGAYRGPWMYGDTEREMMVDHVARVIGVDPVELRRRNMITAAELPYTTPGGETYQEITPVETFDQALEMLDYRAFRAEQDLARRAGRLLGLGISCFIEPTSVGAATLESEGCTVRVEPSGHVTAYVGTSSHGQSIETTMAQIVADVVGMAYDEVTIVQGDTKSTPWGGGTGGSRTAVVTGGAVRDASAVVRDKVVAIAAHALEAAPEDLEVSDGVVSVRGTPAARVAVAEVAKIAYHQVNTLPAELGSGLEATVRFRPERHPTHSNAAHLCVVEVDCDTWKPTVLRYIVSEDCGPMINPMVVEGQVAGGVVQGLGGALYEHFRYDDDGNPLTTTFLDYLLPTTTEVPMIEIGHVETRSSTNPGGYKGVGEGGAIGSHAAVANAVLDALAPLGSASLRELRTPFGPSEIHEMVSSLTGEAPGGARESSHR